VVKLRWLRLIPVVAVLWCVTEVSRLSAQGPSDSLITSVLVRHAIGEWRDSTMRAFCLVWTAERADRPHLLFLLDAVAADTTTTPLCPDPLGGFYPVLLDAPECPDEGRVRVTDRAFILIRCGDGRFARYRRPPGKAT
jgi:hypothetical protein